jgi:hypothetical protein
MPGVSRRRERQWRERVGIEAIPKNVDRFWSVYGLSYELHRKRLKT